MTQNRALVPEQVLEASQSKPWQPVREMVDANGIPIARYARYQLLTWRVGWLQIYVTGAAVQKTISDNIYRIYFVYEVDGDYYNAETASPTPQFDYLTPDYGNDVN